MSRRFWIALVVAALVVLGVVVLSADSADMDDANDGSADVELLDGPER